MHIAFCTDNEAFSKDRLRDKQWSYRFPGSGWITCLYRMASEEGIDVASGDVAIANITSKKWKADDVLVIVERHAADATKLLDLGAKPFLITCLEAPLYAPFFYDKICRAGAGFKFSMGFGFSEEKCGIVGAEQNLPFRFPSFYWDDMREPHPWNDRKKMVLVAANKYRTDKIFIPNYPSLKNLLRQLKSLGWRVASPAYRRALSASLHDRRLEVVEYFARNKDIELYGAGWDSWDLLPTAWANRLEEVVSRQYRGRCGNKLDTISDYKFSVCFENMVLPGYMTEKMVDCFVAGSIPMYWGASDIEMLVSNEAFVDMRKYGSSEQAKEFMNTMDKQAAMKMIQAGREYLKTEIGQLHSYEGFAKNVIGLAQTC